MIGFDQQQNINEEIMANYTKVTISLEVFSNGEDVSDWSLADIADGITSGEICGHHEIVATDILTQEEITEALEEIGVDPSILVDDDETDKDDDGMDDYD